MLGARSWLEPLVGAVTRPRSQDSGEVRQVKVPTRLASRCESQASNGKKPTINALSALLGSLPRLPLEVHNTRSDARATIAR
jgi:hypothetical protein